jgi:hypothetical protein
MTKIRAAYRKNAGKDPRSIGWWNLQSRLFLIDTRPKMRRGIPARFNWLDVRCGLNVKSGNNSKPCLGRVEKSQCDRTHFTISCQMGILLRGSEANDETRYLRGPRKIGAAV